MGASFRNTGEIKELCGCDRLTISPKLLDELKNAEGDLPVKLSAEKANKLEIEEVQVDEAGFRYEMNKSKMATDLLSAGIRSFEQDGETLKEMIRKRINELHPAK
jgi:transaldolase